MINYHTVLTRLTKRKTTKRYRFFVWILQISIKIKWKKKKKTSHFVKTWPHRAPRFICNTSYHAVHMSVTKLYSAFFMHFILVLISWVFFELYSHSLVWKSNLWQALSKKPFFAFNAINSIVFLCVYVEKAVYTSMFVFKSSTQWRVLE